MLTRFKDPGLANANSKTVHVKVDMTLHENQNLVPKNEEDEFIEVFTLPLAELWSHIQKMDKEGYAIDKAIVMLAEGIELAKHWSL